MQKRVLVFLLLAGLSVAACGEKSGVAPEASEKSAVSVTSGYESVDKDHPKAPSAASGKQQAAGGDTKNVSDIGSAERSSNGEVGYSITSIYVLAAIAIFVTIALTLSLLAMNGLLRWRKISSQGMMAVTPITLIDSLEKLQSRAFETLDKRLGEAHQRIVRGLISLDEGQHRHQESVKLLDSELQRKAELVDTLARVVEDNHHDQYIRKLCKLSSFMSTLRLQVSDGRLSGIEAVDFLSDELQESLIESGIKLLAPEVGTPYSSLDKDFCEVVNPEVLQGVKLELVSVGNIRKTGFYRPASKSGDSIVYRKAEVVLKIEGGE